MPPQSFWSLLQRQLQQQLDPEEFATWFRPLKVGDEDGERLVLLAPNSRFLHTLEESYRPAVDRAVAGLAGSEFEVLFSLEDELVADDEPPITPSRFNPKYLFANFVKGKSNELAEAAARRVAENPSLSYNPLFLYGGVGLGKTHLLHAIGHEIQRSRPELRVLYLSAEQFTNELINSIRFDRMPAFRERYRTIDVLMIDDVQFLARKERTQEEFFHTFNTLYTSQKQIILTSDSRPKDIPTLEERLRSRFEWGLTADIQPPDLETKMAILKKKAETESVPLPDNVAIYIAGKIKSNIRELEGSLIRLIAYASLTGQELSLPLAQYVLTNILDHEQKAVTIELIQKFVADYYNLKLGELKSRNNSKSVAKPRQIAMYLCKSLTHASLPEIGRSFGGKHHSTVIHSIRKVEDLRRKDSDFNTLIGGFLEGFR